MHVHYLISPRMASIISKRLQSRAPHATSAHLPRLPEVSEGSRLGVAVPTCSVQRRRAACVHSGFLPRYACNHAITRIIWEILGFWPGKGAQCYLFGNKYIGQG